METRETSRGRYKNFVFGSITVTLSLIACLVVAEVFAQKVMELGDPVIYRSNILWGYAPEPDQVRERRRGAVVTINDSGLRAKLDWQANTKQKMVFFGDSITYGGSYIDDDELFSSITCETLPKFSCYNAGVNGYGVMNIVARSKFDDRIESSSIVIFTIPIGDFYRGLQDENTAHFMLREPNAYFPALHEILNFLASRYSLKHFLGKCCYDVDPSDEDYQRLRAIDWGMKLLANEVSRLRKLDKLVLVAFTPRRDSIGQPEPDAHTAHAFEVAERHGLDVIDLKPVFEQSELSMEQLFYDSAHYERGGHAVVGRFFQERLSALLDRERPGGRNEGPGIAAEKGEQ